MKIKLLVMDVDGTMTDGHIYMGQNGEAMKAFDSKDGYGIAHILPKLGIVPVIITGRNSSIVANRARELGIAELHQGVQDKLPRLRQLADAYHASAAEIAYIGDDLNDLECLQYCGCTACPKDAVPEITRLVTYVCSRNGGSGAVRDFIDSVLAKDSCCAAAK